MPPTAITRDRKLTIDASRDRGSALLMSIFVLALLSTMALILAFVSQTEVKMSVADAAAKQAFHLAEAATECMVDRETCFPAADSGDPGPYECMRNALADACSDSTADGLCEQVAQNCTDYAVSDGECHRMVDGLTEQGRAQIETCVTDGCPHGLWSCVEGLSPE